MPAPAVARPDPIHRENETHGRWCAVYRAHVTRFPARARRVVWPGGSRGLRGCRQRGGAGLAAVARTRRARRLDRVRPADDVEREREHRVARPLAGARHVVAHRVGRSRVRHLAGRQRAGGGRRRASAARARRSSARRIARQSIGGAATRAGRDARRACGSSSKPSARSTARGCGSIAPRPPGRSPSVHEKHNLATPTPVTDGERVYAWFGNGQLVALDMAGTPSSGRAISAWSTRRSRRSGDTAARRCSTATS